MAKRPTRILTDAEIRAMLAQCQNNREKTIVEFLRSTGCRAHEMLSVLIADVDLENERVYLRKTKARVKWKTIIEDGVRKRAHDSSEIVPRYSFLDGESLSALRIYINERKQELAKRLTDDSILFDIDQNDRKDGRAIRYLIKRLAKAAKIPDWQNIHPHSFRHTTATKMIAKNYPTPFIKKTMGWSERSRTFETTYEHADWDMMQKSYKKTVGEEDNWQKDIKEIQPEKKEEKKEEKIEEKNEKKEASSEEE
jgi:integrase